ncbi:TPA: cell division inhibition protein DicB [Escherichia coli]
MVNWLTSPGGTRHRITKFIVEDMIMETLLPDANTSEGCFNLGILISGEVFIEEAISKRKNEPYLLMDGSILSLITINKFNIHREMNQ